MSSIGYADQALSHVLCKDVPRIILSYLKLESWIPCRYRRRVFKGKCERVKCYRSLGTAEQFEPLFPGSRAKDWCTKCFLNRSQDNLYLTAEFRCRIATRSDELMCSRAALSNFMEEKCQSVAIGYRKYFSMAQVEQALIMAKKFVEKLGM
jgi:hypothetical protein